MPKVGMARSIAPEHNVEIDAFCDWIEASLIFDNLEFISASEIIDILHEEEIYSDQDFAWELIERAWAEFRRRSKCLGEEAPFRLEEKRIVRKQTWKERPAYSFFLTLSCATWYPEWAADYTNYTVQGELFELVTAASLEKLLPAWTVHRTGWDPNNQTKITQVVRTVSKILRETEGEVEPWVSPHAKEAGLDIVCYRHFDDGRPNLPTMLIQCSSGKHYEHKLGTPDLKEWQKIIRFIVCPNRWFATPYSMTHSEFIRVCNKVDGLLLDRCRLLSAGNKEEWLQPALKTRLRSWVNSRVKKLERNA